MKKVKMFQIGCGKMSKYTISYALEKGYEVVGAVDVNPKLIGKDLSKVIGGKKTGIIIGDVVDLKKLLKKSKANVAVITTMSLMADCEEVLLACAECGVNAITTCEEAFYPMVSHPKLTKKLDKLCKENGCTITGSGYQDVFWGNLIYTLGGATHRIDKIIGSSSYNVEDYGIALAEAHGAGYTKAKFEKEIASVDKISDEERQELINSGTYSPSYMWNVVPWLADRFGFTLTHMTQKCVPIIAKEDIYSSTLDMTIKKGDCTGMSAVVTGETKEGVIIEAECIGYVYGPGDVDRNEWTIEGEPSTTVVITEPKTVELTCASIINRIPDVLNTIPGYIPTSQLGELEYRG